MGTVTAFSVTIPPHANANQSTWVRGTSPCSTNRLFLISRPRAARLLPFRRHNRDDGIAPVPSSTKQATTTALMDGLAERMGEAVRKMRGVNKITETNVKGAMKEVKRSLLDADVNLRVVNKLIRDIKNRAIGEEVIPGVEPGQMLVKIMHEELTNVMGKNQSGLAHRTDSNPTVILLAGLQGAGKTTAAAKLALYCLKEKRSVSMVACDVYRPAAIDQLKKLGSFIDVDVFSLGSDADPREIARRGIEEAREKGIDTVIVDTAGRQVIDAKLMKELKDLKAVTKPDETLLVVDAMTGQEAATVTRAFNNEVSITGAVLTKMDGDTRGGAALSVQQVSGCPIKFIGVGEKLEKLEPFYPERMASRILGMGDVLTLVEKAKEAFDAKEAEKMTKKMMESKFDFNDFLKQTKMMSNIGSLGGMLKMMPGVGAQLSNEKIAQAEQKLKIADSLIKSMTKKERSNPELLFKSPTANQRLQRIAKGSGRSEVDARNLINDFQRMRTMMARMSKQMLGSDPNNIDPQALAAGGGAGVNRAARRRAGKKKAMKGGQKRGFG